MRRLVNIPAAQFALACGKTTAEIARVQGFTAKAIRRALEKEGVARQPREPHDARLDGAWRRVERSGWADRPAFVAWAKSSGFQPGLVIERKNAARPWSPSNARWVTRSVAAKKAQVGIDTTAPRGAPIDWNRVRRLYATRDVRETARAVGASYHGVLRGLRKRGWLRAKETPVAALEHGTALYRAWMGMRSRCETPTEPGYASIGAKGIRMRWPGFRPFHAWALDAGYEPGLVLVRLNRAKDYGPANCRWVSLAEANAYHRPLTISREPRRMLTAFGETKGLVEWTRDPRCAVGTSGLAKRLADGMRPELALTKPSADRGPRTGKRLVTAFGVTKSVAAWARDPRAKVGASSIYERLRAGWTAEEAIGVRAMGR